jgi:fatty acid desaturase/rubredoxin
MATARTQVDWFRVPLEPELLKELNTVSDRKAWIQAGGHLLLTAFTAMATIVVWANWSWYWAIPVLIFHGAVQTMLLAGAHELVHGRVFSSRRLNRFFLWVNSFLGGWNYPFYEVSHKDHHRYTLNQPHDLEVVQPSVEVLMNLKPTTRWQTFIGWCQHAFAWKAIWPTFKRHWDFAKGSYPHNSEPGGIFSQVWCEHLFNIITEPEKRAIRNNSRAFLLGHGAIVVISLALGWWIVPLVICLGYFFGGAVAYWTGMPQHAGLMDNIDDFRLCCRSYTCSRFLQFLYWNMNYHTEHHMYAAVPCYNLPRLHEAVKAYMPPMHTSLYSSWCEIKQIEFRQQFNPTYQYRQPLPEEQEGNELSRLAHVADQSAAEYLELSDAEPPEAIDPVDEWKLWECEVCGFIYDEALGLPEEGIVPETRWEDIPDDWCCPDCGVAKASFSMIQRSRVATAATGGNPQAT